MARGLNAHDTSLFPCRYAQATWFNVGLGACGVENTDDDFIVALAQPDWDGGSHCGQVSSTPFLMGSGGAPDLVTFSISQELQITNPSNGRVETATVRDLCPGCPSGNLGESHPPLFSATILTSHLLSRRPISQSLQGLG